MPVIRVEDLTYIYGAGTPFEIKALDNINFSLEKGEILGIIGHTGSGKSTLVQHLNCLIKPTSGRIYIDEEDVLADVKNIRNVRFKVGLVFQYPEYQLFEETVYKDIAYGPSNMGIKGEELDERVKRAASFTGLTAAQLEKSPFDLSGGEKRRAAIAGVIALEPQVLILDEPTAGLDPRGRDMILDLIKDYRDKCSTTVILVSHSMEDVANYADKVLVMNRGRAVCCGNVDEVFGNTDILTDAGLDVPDVTVIFNKLHKMGVPLDPNVYRMSEAQSRLFSLLGEVRR